MRERSSILNAVLSLGLLIAVGVAGYVLIEQASFLDALYMTVTTLSTVGYREVVPLTTAGKLFTMALIVCGLGVVFYGTSLVAGDVIEGRLRLVLGRRRVQRRIEQLSNHYIVCGAGRVGRSVVRELRRSGVPVLLIDTDAHRAEWGIHDGIPTLIADATQDETLRRASISSAKGLVAAIGNDAENVYVTLSAHVLNPNLIITARATDEQAEEKLRRAGATTVFTPYTFIGHRLAQAMLRPHVLNFLDVASAFSQGSDLTIETEQLYITPASPLCGRSLEDSGVRQVYGVIVLALKKTAGAMMFNPDAKIKLEGGDVLIAIGERAQLKRIGEELKVQATRA